MLGSRTCKACSERHYVAGQFPRTCTGTAWSCAAGQWCSLMVPLEEATGRMGEMQLAVSMVIMPNGMWIQLK